MAMFPLNQRGAYKIDATVHGLWGHLGPAGPGTTGVWTLQWEPDLSFDGQLAVQGRIAGEDAKNAVFVPMPYIAVYLNAAVPASPRSWASDMIQSTSWIEIPTAGSDPAVLFNIVSGFGMLYVLDVMGASPT